MRKIAGMIASTLLVAACTGSDSGVEVADEQPVSTSDQQEVPSTTQPVAESTVPESTDTTEAPETTVAATAPPTVPEIEVTPLPGVGDISDDPFPNSVEVRTGTLDNGLQYYIKNNDRPGAKASLQLAIDAGSVQELDEVTGVAHFAEHMLFNGTEKYPENELIDVLRSFGADFGPDINAYTSWHETVYQLEVPNDDESIDTGLDVLDQWLNAATFTEADAVGERGVVLDEWRVRTQTLSGRLFDVAADLYLAGTPYDGRAPIGTNTDIENMEASTLRNFYDTWYRPDNAAIIVVGEIDVDDIEAKIIDIFAASAPRTDAELSGSEEIVFPLDTEPDFALHSDSDQTTVDVEVTLPLPATAGDGTLAFTASVYDELIFDILLRRLQRDVAAGTAPFDDISPGSNSFVDELDAPALYAFTDAQRVHDTLDALLAEYERAFRYGFTDDEVATAVDAARSGWDAYLAQDGERQDSTYASLFVGHFLDGSAYSRVADDYSVALSVLEGVDAAGLAERFNARWTNTAPHVIISTPSAQQDLMPTAADVFASVEAAVVADVEPRESLGDLPDSLMERPAGTASDSATSLTDYSWAQFNPVRYDYPNGATVVLNPNTIVEGQVYLSAHSPGGSSLVADDDVIDALYAAPVVGASGIADFNAAEFAEITSTSQASVSPAIDVYAERFSGEAATDDVETMLQMLHLYMTAPRFDEVALNQVIRRNQPSIDDPTIDPGSAGTDLLYEALYGNEVRYSVLPTPEQFATLDLDGIERVWVDRFADASDWVFVINGDFDVAALEELADAYIGTLPTDDTPEAPIDVSDTPPAGVTEVGISAGTGDTASVELLFTSSIDEISPANQGLADATTAILDARLTRVVREEFGDSYSPSITTYLSQDPEPVANTYVYVTGSPDRIGAIADTVVEQIADIRNGGLTDAEFANSIAPTVESYGFVNNGQYARELIRDLTIDGYELDDYVFAFEIIESIERDDVVNFIGEHIDPTEYVSSTVTPK